MNGGTESSHVIQWHLGYSFPFFDDEDARERIALIEPESIGSTRDQVLG